VKNRQGLYNKYEVLQDGQLVEELCFVLKPKTDPIALMALETYACNTHNLRLRQDLHEWIDEIRRWRKGARHQTINATGRGIK